MQPEVRPFYSACRVDHQFDEAQEAITRVLSKHEFIFPCLVDRFRQHFKPDILFNFLTALARDLASQKRSEGFCALIDRTCKSQMYNFFGAHLEHVVADYGLQAFHLTDAESVRDSLADLLALAGSDARALDATSSHEFRIKLHSPIIPTTPLYVQTRPRPCVHFPSGAVGLRTTCLLCSPFYWAHVSALSAEYLIQKMHKLTPPHT